MERKYYNRIWKKIIIKMLDLQKKNQFMKMKSLKVNKLRILNKRLRMCILNFIKKKLKEKDLEIDKKV